MAWQYCGAFQLVAELQALLASWAGRCPTCGAHLHRHARPVPT
ncbi:hypothetical protein [Thermomonospora echinospora]|nr:hypothetical protein [Thermomonospora echinospora]